jgi:hypothetical protein
MPAGRPWNVRKGSPYSRGRLNLNIGVNATILSVFDPTRIAGLVSAYTFLKYQDISNEPTGSSVASPVDAPAGAPSGGESTTTGGDECKCSWWDFFCRM